MGIRTFATAFLVEISRLASSELAWMNGNFEKAARRGLIFKLPKAS